jgi:hypothetical protein
MAFPTRSMHVEVADTEISLSPFSLTPSLRPGEIWLQLCCPHLFLFSNQGDNEVNDSAMVVCLRVGLVTVACLGADSMMVVHA